MINYSSWVVLQYLEDNAIYSSNLTLAIHTTRFAYHTGTPGLALDNYTPRLAWDADNTKLSIR